MRGRIGRALMLLAVLAVAWRAEGAPGSPAGAAGKPVAFRGYLNLRYAYSGSAASAVSSHGLRLTGQFRLSAFADRLRLVFRSHNWFHFARTRGTVLESPYVNRRIVQSLYLETSDLLARGLVLRAGRFFPDIDYTALPLLDGGGLRWSSGRWTLAAAAGRGVDPWNGREMGSDWHGAVGLQFRSERLRLALAGSGGSFQEWRRREVASGLDAKLGGSLWLDGYAAYDWSARGMSRGGVGLSWRPDAGVLNVSLQATWWRSPFDQFYDASRPSALHDWMSPDWRPQQFSDLRLTVSARGRHWGWRGTAGVMQGVRSGWLANAFVQRTVFGPLRLEAGGQVMESDFIHYYSAQAGLQAALPAFTLELRTQSQVYQWQPRPSGFRNSDNFSELRLEVPVGRRLYLSVGGGAFFRELGDEKVRLQLEANVIYRF